MKKIRCKSHEQSGVQLTTMIEPTNIVYVKKSPGCVNRDDSRSRPLPYWYTVAGQLQLRGGRWVGMRTEVRIQQDSKFRLRDEERRHQPPHLRQRLQREDQRRDEGKLRQAKNARVTQGRHDHSCSCDGPTNSLLVRVFRVDASRH